MNVIELDGERLVLSGMDGPTITSLQKKYRLLGRESCIDPMTGLPVTLTRPHVRAGGTIAVCAFSSFYSDAEIVSLDGEYLYDNERMVADWRGEDATHKSKGVDENGDPIAYISISQNADLSQRGESKLHVDGNQRIRDEHWKEIINEFCLNDLAVDTEVTAEHKLLIPHRAGKYRIIDNALVTSDGLTTVALELQCSVISTRHLDARISDYIQTNVAQVWILAGDAYRNRTMEAALYKRGVPFCSWSNGAS